MVDIADSKWTEEDDGNIAPSPDGVQNGYSPKANAPIMRAIRGGVKRFYNRINAIYTSTGNGAAYVLTPDVALPLYTKGERFAFFAHAANTGPVTLNISGLGAKQVFRSDGTTLTANEIKAGGFVEVVYNGTNFSVVGFSLPTNVNVAGNLGVGGTATAASFVGNGSALTALDASKITTGTLNDARLPATMTGKTFSSPLTVQGNTTISAASGALIVNAQDTGNSAVFHRIDNVLRGYTVYDRSTSSLAFGLHNSTGAGVRSMTYRESDGLLNVNGSITTNGNVSGATVSATGAISAGSFTTNGRVTTASGVDIGTAKVDTTGNVTGTAWGTSLKAYIDDKFGSIATMPIGTVIDVYGNGNATIPGFLKVVPGLEITASYPQLRAFGLANGWAVNGAGNPVMPTGDALFKRGWRAGQSRDAGRAFGSVQEDAFQGHQHDFWFNDSNAGKQVASLSNASYGGTTGPRTYGGLYSANILEFNGNGQPRVAAETRPANFTVTYYIKAYETPVDKGTVDVAKLADDISGVGSRTSILEPKVAALEARPQGFGEGQEWQNVTASRGTNVTYQNTTGKPIMVIVAGAIFDINYAGQVSPDGTTWVTLFNHNLTIYDSQASSGKKVSASFVVPVGHYYRVNRGAGNGNYKPETWTELR